MTEAQDKATLGEPNATSKAHREAEENGDDPGASGARLMRWRNGKSWVEVAFGRDGTVTDIGYYYP